MGSSSSGSAKRAQEAEDQRRADIEATQARIESIFGSDKRESEIEDFINANRGILQSDLNRTKETNDRKLKFALARSGQSGSSTDIDQNKNLSEAFLRASIEGERRAQGAGQSLRQSDQQAKMSLFSQALGGLDMTTASNNAMESMRNNIDLSKNISSENNFDAFFKDSGTFYKDSREAAGRRQQAAEFNTLYGQRPTVVQQVAGGS